VSHEPLDPVIHAPARLRIVVTLAALADGDTLSFRRLQDMIELTAGNLITHLRKLEDAGYVESTKIGSGTTGQTKIALTPDGRTARRTYRKALQQLLGDAAV
jgi:DNA-binding MarR family transcriptional regulator